MTSTRSPLRGRYLVQNPLWNTWLRSSDSLLNFLGESSDSGLPESPRRLLLHIGGHLGDAVIATSVLRPLKSKWPELEIGVLTGSWNRQVLAGLADIKWMHSADHWKLNRAGDSLLSRAAHFALSSSTAIRDISRVGYDIAIDLYPYYPNAGSLLRRAGIPVRVGYCSGGGGAHFTRRLDWKDTGHVTKDHGRLLAAVGVEMASVSYLLPSIDSSAREKLRREIANAGADWQRYVVLHMGAGNPIKEWPLAEWASVASGVVAGGHSVVLTGAGARDGELARSLKHLVPSAVDLVDRVDWAGYTAAIANARAVVSVDTVAGHMSAGFDRPTVVVATGTDARNRWAPVGNKVTVLSESVECAPCYRARGCGTMNCVRGVRAEQVRRALNAFLG